MITVKNSVRARDGNCWDYREKPKATITPSSVHGTDSWYLEKILKMIHRLVIILVLIA